ncbi:DUF5799 family protein [Halapricum hydrolyticum]|uniref:DUF5799 family protein n=1 Tax=Halapricum hydrolyticum TaxID=2979991 RepID=A0AAE3IC54_9EURY|nr:DUF5799 family protein [Halapricum hydrolyticum]MCU4718714.1 DUF5799 family protein [Halapricum hydrolyticum]MCU4727701.1 DUF5799 family protein [Halapricum hydrolyticum]
MSDNSWRDMLAAERMRVDRQFEDRVQSSSFTRQQWGLVMTAVEFDVENPADPDAARLIADTSKLSSVMPQIKQMEQSGGAMGGAAGGGGGGGGLLSKLASVLPGGGGSGGGKRQREAESLAEEYAEKLQERLEKRDRWQSIREQAAQES